MTVDARPFTNVPESLVPALRGEMPVARFYDREVSSRTVWKPVKSRVFTHNLPFREGFEGRSSTELSFVPGTVQRHASREEALVAARTLFGENDGLPAGFPVPVGIFKVSPDQFYVGVLAEPYGKSAWHVVESIDSASPSPQVATQALLPQLVMVVTPKGYHEVSPANPPPFASQTWSRPIQPSEYAGYRIDV